MTQINKLRSRDGEYSRSVRNCAIVALVPSYQHVHKLRTVLTKVRPSDIKYLKIKAHDPYRGDLMELNPGMYSFFKLEDI